MDTKVIRGIIVIASIGMQAYAGLPVSLEGILSALAMLGLGAAVVKRPGDQSGHGI